MSGFDGILVEFWEQVELPEGFLVLEEVGLDVGMGVGIDHLPVCGNPGVYFKLEVESGFVDRWIGEFFVDRCVCQVLGVGPVDVGREVHRTGAKSFVRAGDDDDWVITDVLEDFALERTEIDVGSFLTVTELDAVFKFAKASVDFRWNILPGWFPS